MMKAPDAHRRVRGLLRVLNRILDVAVILTILLAMAYSIYSIWDNNSIYQAAMDLSTRIRKEKPEGKKPSFEDLQKINKDVCAWITLEGTQIDNPIVQGHSNEEYLNKDVYGDYSLEERCFWTPGAIGTLRTSTSWFTGTTWTGIRCSAILTCIWRRTFSTNTRTVCF